MMKALLVVGDPAASSTLAVGGGKGREEQRTRSQTRGQRGTLWGLGRTGLSVKFSTVSSYASVLPDRRLTICHYSQRATSQEKRHTWSKAKPVYASIGRKMITLVTGQCLLALPDSIWGICHRLRLVTSSAPFPDTSARGSLVT